MGRFGDYVASLAPNGFWPLGELSGNTAADLSPRASYPGSYLSAASLGQAGLISADYGRSVYLLGSANAVAVFPGGAIAGASGSLTPTAGFTVGAWINPIPAAGSIHSMLARASGFDFRINYSAGGSALPGFHHMNGAAETALAAPALASGRAFLVGQFAPSGWFGGGPGFTAIYTNGLLAASAAASKLGVASGEFWVGGRPDLTGALNFGLMGREQYAFSIPTIIGTQQVADLYAVGIQDTGADVVPYLTGPQGSVYPLASYLRADPGPDYGTEALSQPFYSENALQDGGAYSYDRAGIRKMTFPLRLASSGGGGLGLEGLEAQLRQAAAPGAYLTLMAPNMASSDGIRYDVLDGRLTHEGFNVYSNKVGRRDAVLEVDVQPFGYLPTKILIASVASIGAPGVLALPNALIGDVPGLGELFIAATSATAYATSGPFTQVTAEALVWSLAARASFQAFWPPASLLASGPGGLATMIAAAQAPASQARWFMYAPALGSTFQKVADFVVPAALEPAYRGRYRVFTDVRSTSSSIFQISLDAQSGTGAEQALGSAARIATVFPNYGSYAGIGGAFTATVLFEFLDLGEITLPPVGSYNNDLDIRFWVQQASLGAGSAGLHVGGLYLLPVDGAVGVLPRGMQQPTSNFGGILSRQKISAVTGDAILGSATSTIASMAPIKDAFNYYTGLLPLVGASTVQLDLNISGRHPAHPAPLTRTEPFYSQVSLSYRPRFSFVKSF